MALVTSVFIYKINLEINNTFQNVLHITVILSAFSYLLFADMVYNTEPNKEYARLVLIFSALFTIPIIIGRGIGIYYISNSLDNIFNFYGTVSISRAIELLSWTTFYPFSMLFMSLMFFKNNKSIAWLSIISSICCFIAFMSYFSTNSIYLYIGLLGWGPLFILVLIFYLLYQIKLHKNI